MKHYRLLIAIAGFALLATTASATDCASQVGREYIGAGGGYTWIANGFFLSGADGFDCWQTHAGNLSVVSTPACTVNASKSVDMHYGARLSQEFIMPSGHSETHWDLSYLLTMQDPNNDGWWNRIQATVYNDTTHHVLAQQTYWGDDPDITCSRRDLTFTASINAGDKIVVTFSDGSAYNNTVIRVTSIALLSY